MRPPRADIAAPALPPRIRWLNSEPRSMAELARRRARARPLLRLRPAQLRALAPLRRGLARALRRGGPDGPRRPLPQVPVHRDPRRDRARARAPRDRPAGRAGLLVRDLERLRLPGLALALPLGRARGAALVSLRRGRVRRDRGGDPGGAAGGGRARRAARAARAPAPHRRPRGVGRAAQRGALPGWLPAEPWRAEHDGDSIEVSYEAGGAYAAIDGTGRLRWSVDGARAVDSRSPTPASTSSPSIPSTASHLLELGPPPAWTLYAISFAAGLPGPLDTRRPPRSSLPVWAGRGRIAAGGAAVDRLCRSRRRGARRNLQADAVRRSRSQRLQAG